MKAPDSLRFGGRIWKVELVSELLDKKQELLGKCDYADSTIRVVKKQSLDSLKSTLLHECIHAQAEAQGWEAKEITVIKIEKLIYAMLKDNPKLFRWLLNSRMDCPVCGKPAGTCDCNE